MSGYYRTIFAIGSKDDAPSSQVIGDAWRLVRDWVAGEYGDPYQSGEQRGEWEGANGHLRLYDRALNDMRLCNLVWTRDDADASGSRWRMSLRLAADGNAVEADIEVRGIEGDGGETPSELMAGPPSALGHLVEQFDCGIGGELLQTAAKRIGAGESDAFVRDEILSESRRMPLLVVTGYRQGGGAVDADELQRELIGLARVFAYDHNTAFNVMRDLPQALWCYDGAVRLYAPGCSEGDLSQQHPFWLPHVVNRLERDNRLGDMLRDECVDRMSRQNQGRLYSQLRERAGKADAKASEDLSIEVESENQDLRSENQSLRNEVRRLREANKQLSIAQQYLDADDPGAGLDDVDELPTEFDSVAKAVEYAKGTMDRLRFFSDAVKVGKGSSLPRPNDVHDALNALNECAVERTRGPLGMDVEKWLKGKGIDYAPREGETTKEMYRSERTFTDDLRKTRVLMLPHIKLGREHRIHLIWGEDAGSAEKKWLIGYIGRHLPTAKNPN